MKQETFTDIEYSFRKKKTRREEFLEIMDEIIPWDEWVDVIKPCYPKGKRGRPPMGIEKMLLCKFRHLLEENGLNKLFFDAIKAHCARIAKKKMTKAEFEAWSRYAVELREQAEQKEISFDAYVQEIKK